MWEECKPVEIRHVKDQWVETGLPRLGGRTSSSFSVKFDFLANLFQILYSNGEMSSDCVAVAAAAVAWSDWSASVASNQQKAGCGSLPPLVVASA